MKSLFSKFIFVLSILISLISGAKEKDFEKVKLSEWQKNPLGLYQVRGQRLFIDASGVFMAGNYKNSASQEADKIEGFGADFQGEFGINDMFAGHVSLGYLSSKQKNSLVTYTSEGAQDLGLSMKMKLATPLVIMIEAGAETSLEALKVDAVARTTTAGSGGTKVTAKAGILFPSESLMYGAWTQYKYFVQREMDLVTTLGSEKLKIDGGHQLVAAGFVEFGSGLRTGVDLMWSLYNGSTVNSVNAPTMVDFELEHQRVTGGAYLKIPAGENLLLYIKGNYSLNVNKKRGAQNMDQDDFYQANVGLQTLF